MKLPCSKCGRVEPQTCSQAGCPYFLSRPRTFKKDFFGAAPNVFVGRYGYPDVRVGILATEEYTGNDDPKAWSAQETAIPDILDQRGALVNSRFLANVRSFNDRFLESAQLVVQSKKPVDTEVKLDKVPSWRITYPQGVSPHGASVKLVQARLTENVRIPRAVDKAVSDPELKANAALKQLYGKIDEYAMSKLLTGGVLGMKKGRKLVPTRWGITAVDDTLGKQLLEQVRDQPVLSEPKALFGGHYGNFYVVLLLPRPWQFELFEFATGASAKGMKKRVWTDHEGFAGRTQYAKDTAGGYYAARLPILEYLRDQKRQAAVLCLRFVTEDYTHPLGVWVVREAVRKALLAKPLSFADENLLFKYAKARSQQYGVDWQREVEEPSILLSSLTQRTLSDFSG